MATPNEKNSTSNDVSTDTDESVCANDPSDCHVNENVSSSSSKFADTDIFQLPAGAGDLPFTK